MGHSLFIMCAVLVISCCSCNGQMIIDDQSILIMKTIVDNIDKLMEKVEGQQEKLANLEEKQKAVDETLGGIRMKLTSIEESQELMTQTLLGLSEESKNFVTRDRMEAFQIMSKTGQQEIMASVHRHSCGKQLPDFQDLLSADECRDGSHNCSSLATCTDRLVLYTCDCHLGYTGDGFTCTDIDECDGESDSICSVNEKCNNTPGSYNCNCQDGYEYDEAGVCQDIDECQRGLHKCQAPSFCINVNGSHECHDPQCNEPSLYMEDLGCITPILTRLTWATAKTKCESLGMRLLEGIQKEHLETLSNHFKPMMPKRPYPWVGFKGKKWISSGLPVSTQVVASGESGLDGECGNVDLRVNQRGLWDGGCSVKDFSLCQRIR